MLLDRVFKHFYDLMRVFKVDMSELIEQSFVTKPLLLQVLGLVETVGIYEQRTALDTIDLLALELQAVPHADRCVGFHLDERTALGIASICIASKQRRVMASVAEIQMACTEIRQSDEHRDKHALLVVFS